jgi:hypothetical protein
MGSGFGAARETGFVKLAGERCVTYLSWEATRISWIVPGEAKYGAVQVTMTTPGGTSNAASASVTR